MVDLALEKTELSSRELACHFTDEKRYFLSESSVYRILKAYDLITSPAFVLLSASDRFSRSNTACPRDVADRLHLPSGDRLGLVLPLDGDGRLLALHRLLEAQADDVGLGRDGDTRRCRRAHGSRQRAGEAPAAAAQRQRPGVPVEGSRRLSRRARHDAHAWAAVPSHRRRARSSAITAR